MTEILVTPISHCEEPRWNRVTIPGSHSLQHNYFDVSITKLNYKQVILTLHYFDYSSNVFCSYIAPTDLPVWIRWIVSPKSGAMGNTAILSSFFSLVTGMVSTTTTSFTRDFGNPVYGVIRENRMRRTGVDFLCAAFE